jgi:hypothetical protein
MRKLTSCGIATTAILALILSAHASPGSVMTHAAGLYSASGFGPVILVVDGQNTGNDQKRAIRRKRGSSKQQQKMQQMQQMQQMMQSVPPEYQQYLPQGGMGGGGMGGGGMGGGGMGGYGR